MYFSSKVAIFVTILLLPFTGNAGDIVPLPSTSDGIYSRGPQMEAGKVKHISKDQLPSDLREATEKDIEKSKHEYVTAPEAYFEFANNYYNHLRTGPDSLSNVQVSLVDISSTKLAEYKCEGFIPEGPTKKGPWTSVTRVFKRPDGMIIKLSEWDFVADGGAIVLVDELMNSNVAGIPAYLSVKQSPSGRAATILEWVTDKKQYTLTAEDNIKIRGLRKLSDHKWLLAIANSLASSDNK